MDVLEVAVRTAWDAGSGGLVVAVVFVVPVFMVVVAAVTVGLSSAFGRDVERREHALRLVAAFTDLTAVLMSRRRGGRWHGRVAGGDREGAEHVPRS